MKRSLSIFALALATAFSIHAQAAPDAPELTRMLNEFLAGAGRNDAAVHDRFWADDLIYTRSAGVRTNKEEIMKGLKGPAPAPKPGDPVTVYTADDIKIQQYGNAAVVAFRLVSTTTKVDGTKTTGNNLNTGTFIKRNGKWQVVAWQSTIVPKAEPTSSTDSKAATSTAVTLVSPKPTTSTSTNGRTYQKGPRGGCYYLNSSSAKVYVDHKFCS